MDNYKSKILKQTVLHLNSACSHAGMTPFEYNDIASGDSTAGIRLSNNGLVLDACIQSWAPQQDFATLVKRVKTFSPDGLLLADFINPVMAEKLRKASIQFVDCSANMRLKMQGIDIFQHGNRDIRQSNKRARGRVFNPAGLRLLYAFLNRPELLNVSYRTLCSEVGVALGSIGPVFDDLQLSGYLAEKDGSKYLINKKRLFERWVDAYLEKLRPGQLLWIYQAPQNDWWKQVEISHYQAQWGGEVVIAQQTPFMLPDNVTVYCGNDEYEKFADDCRLQPDVEGDVTLYQAFWPVKPGDEKVSPMIVYADLLDSVDPANWEVAKTFYGEAIGDLLKE